MGDFQSVGPKVWNILPGEVTRLNSISVFKPKLKTHLFLISYNLWFQ